MNIAIVIPALHYGGAEKQVEFLAIELIKRNHKVAVYCLADDGIIARRLRNSKVRVINLRFKTLWKTYEAIKKVNWFYNNKNTYFGNYSAFRKRQPNLDRAVRFANEICASIKLYAMFLKNRPDVVHLYQNTAKTAIFIAKARGIKKVIYTETSRIGDWFSGFQLCVLRIFFRFCDNIVALSGSMKEHMLELKLAPYSKICIIPTMFPLPDSKKYSGRENNGAVINIGIVGRLLREKGHIYFLEAASLILKKSNNVRFIIAGDGYLKDDLMKLSRKLNLEKSVEFIGSFDDIGPVMKIIDIFVLSSLTEGLPVTLIEAMAYGKPIVATDVGGIGNILANGENGFLVPPKDSHALAEAIYTLINDREKRLEFSRISKSIFDEKYDTKVVMPVIEALYYSKT